MLSVHDQFLSEDDLDFFCSKILHASKRKNSLQRIVHDPEFTQRFWEGYGDRFRTMGYTAIAPSVTLTRSLSAIRWHIDSKTTENDRAKSLIYLNPLSSGGGTFFYPPNEEEVHVEHRVNRMVLFDLSLQHKGEPFPFGEAKMAIGFRLQ